MKDISAVCVDHPVPGTRWHVRIEVLTTAPLEARVWIQSDDDTGTWRRVELVGESQEGLEVRCGGRPGFPRGVPKLVQDLAVSILCGSVHLE